MARGFLLALEGLDGVGKSTVAAELYRLLTRAGVTAHLTCEPTYGMHGASIRDAMQRGHRLDPMDELNAFTADRHEHIQSVLLPSLYRGEVVITDRYFYSTVAYQGDVVVPWADIARQQRALCPIPDLAVLLTCAPTVLAARRITRPKPTVFDGDDALQARADVIFRSMADLVHIPTDCDTAETCSAILAQMFRRR